MEFRTTRSGEAVKLFVVAGNREFADRDLIDFCSGELMACNAPTQFDVVAELPESNGGEVLRRELREL